jgi:hypothetical protein
VAPVNRKLRTGFLKVPRWIFQDIPLTSDERFLLMYFASHDPVKYEHHVNHICKALGWGEEKYYKNRRLLVDKGFLTTIEVRKFSQSSGKKVVTGLRAEANLSTVIQYLENAPGSRLSGPSKPVPLRREISKKGASPDPLEGDGEVIDHQDDSWSP